MLMVYKHKDLKYQRVYDGVSCKLASSDIIEKWKTNLSSLYHKMMSEAIDELNT